ncbi:MAG: hypothetical protein SV108_07845 [Pseudomonadota bacterium]|nr:hypothetical protein [Pseudomonadota bacterium]HJO35495.1 hypothetical protein [Gammaproteobacteria bacterium]
MYDRLRSMMLARRVRHALDTRHPEVAMHVVSLRPPQGYYTGAVRLPDVSDDVPHIVALRWWSPEMSANQVADRIAREIAPLVRQQPADRSADALLRCGPGLIRRERA